MPYIGRSLGDGVRARYIYAATSGQTSFSGNDANGIALAYSDTLYMDVYQNGVLLKPVTDYASTTGTSVVLVTGASTDDVLEMIVYDSFAVADTVSAKDGGSFAGAVSMASTLDVTGAITSSAGATITTADNNAQLTLKSTDADGSVGPVLDLVRDSASPADGDAIGQIKHIADNDAGEATTYSSAFTTLRDASDGAEDGQTINYVMTNGSLVDHLRMGRGSAGGQSAVVINEGSADIDFRVESNDNYGMFFLDAGNNRVGIGTAGPDQFFQVQADEAANYAARIANDGNNANRYGLLILAGTDDNSGTNTLIGFGDGDGSGIGGITASGGTVSYNAFTAGHYCIIPDSDNTPDSTDNAYPYGTLLETTSVIYTQKDSADTERGILYNVRKTQSANSKAVIGAYAGCMNTNLTHIDGTRVTNRHQVYVVGDGHILCNNAGGNIEVGDGICSSSTEGIGQKATANPSMIIGIAQEAVTFSNGTETKLVAVQYGLQQFIPWS